MKKSAKAKGISIADIERAMGQKADEISAPKFDPETMSWTREIRFNLKTAPPVPRERSEHGTKER